MGGDAIFSALKEHLGIENDGVTADGKVSLEHIECNAACDYAPVVMANWEFYDNQTVESAKALVDGARAGNPPAPTRGPNRLVTYKEASAVLAGLDDGLAREGVQAGEATLLDSSSRRKESNVKVNSRPFRTLGSTRFIYHRGVYTQRWIHSI